MTPPEDDRLLIGGGILAYTHPLDTSFSRKELMLASDFELAEIRMSGKSIMYSMKPPDTGWPGPELVGKKYDEVRSSREFVSSLAAMRNSPEFLATSRDPETDIFRLRRDLICGRLAEDLGLIYRKASYASPFATCLRPHRYTATLSMSADAR